jgi:hypothetical protein
MPLYHCTHDALADGAIIEPGNYGRVIRLTGPNHRHWHRENILEQVRLRLFPEKPSRLSATFCCDSLQTALCYKSAQHRVEDFLYEVELIDPGARRHKGDFNAVEPLPRCQANMEEIAVRYWQYSLKTKVWEGVECSEIVSASPLQKLVPDSGPIL